MLQNRGLVIEVEENGARIPRIVIEDLGLLPGDEIFLVHRTNNSLLLVPRKKIQREENTKAEKPVQEQENNLTLVH